MSAVIDRLPIAVRAYTERASTPRPRRRAPKLDKPSDWTLVFDTETTTDAAQRLRFGVYQVRKADQLVESGVFFDPHLSPDERGTLRTFAETHDLKCRPLSEFVDKVFFRIGYGHRGTIVGFNLPFDISRLAIAHAPARLSMRGGFSFQLSTLPSQARVRVKHLSRTMSLIDFATPGKNETPRGSRKRGLKTPTHRGYFVDVSTVAAALLSERFNLDRLCKRLNTSTQKLSDAEHGAALTDQYLDYACADVQATWECFVALRDQYAQHRLAKPLHRIMSEASLGKAYLEVMGVEPFLEKQPDFPRRLLGQIISAYYGGRAEIRWRRTPKRVLYCDFKSMYPTVNALMGLWRFVVASEMRWRDDTEAVRKLLAEASAETLATPRSWRDLAVLVRVRPDSDLFPVRAKYADASMHTIGLNYLTCESDLWFTLADCIAAKILSGKAPTILEAIRFEPGEPQSNLKSVALFGKPTYRVDPASDDVFARFVDLRDAAKDAGDDIQQAIKIIANATSYGIFIEVQRDDVETCAPLAVYGPQPRGIIQTKAIEQPGRFFHPLLGVLITGAARLMLALAERKTLDAGLDWAFCDTDSIAIVKPDEVCEEEFAARTQSVVDWFDTLNPYEKLGSILKIEDTNHSIGDRDKRTPLYCFAISAKRYALFNLDTEGRSVIRKASAHGLGHLLAPYSEGDAPQEIPDPSVSLASIGVERWHYDLWYKIVSAGLGDAPRSVRLTYQPALARAALTRFGVTSPTLERWMTTWNAKRPYSERVKPFGFMTTLQPLNALQPDESVSTSEVFRRGRPRKPIEIKPVAPFSRTSDDAVANAFDRETGGPIAADRLKSYAEALAQYHLHPEDKFLGGDYWESGRTERRHVVASGVRLIGKEANKWEEQAHSVGGGHDVSEFGAASLQQPARRTVRLVRPSTRKL